VVACPPLAELEPGFEIWLPKIHTLARELSLNIFCYCNSATNEAIHDVFRQRKQKCGFIFPEEYDYEDLNLLQKLVDRNDMLFYVAARRTSVSYNNCMDNIQEKLEKQFPDNSKIVIYPRVHHIDSKFSEYGDINPDPFSQGLERVQKIGKDLGNLLKREHKG
jgi:hypothetical protein